MSESLPLHPERLLEHSEWVRRLAGRLVYDAAGADDVAQETLLVALGAGPRDATRPRPWLAAIARRVVARTRRTAARRDARERAVAQDESLEATDEIVARASLQRAVVDAVLALAEPYRTTVLQRFFDDLPNSVIAQRRGLPVETVRTRLKRGLAMLRERLARDLAVETEDGRKWSGLGALMLLIEPTRAAPIGVAAATLTGAMVMTMKAKVVIAVLLVGAAAAGSWVAVVSATRRVASDRAGVAVAPPAQSPGPAARDATLQPTVTEEVDARSAGEETSLANMAAPPARTRSPLVEKLRTEMLTDNSGNVYVIDDDGPELRAALQGLQTDSVDLVPLVEYLESRLADSWLVAGSIESKTNGDDRTESWIDGYENSKGDVSTAFLVTGTSKSSRTVVYGVPVTRWGSELDVGVDRDPDRDLKIYPRLNLIMNLNADGRMSGNLYVHYQPMARNSEALDAADAKLEELGRSHRLPADATWSTKDGGRELRYWPGTAGRLQKGAARSSRPLRAQELDRLTHLFERCFARAKEVRETKTK